MNQTIFLELDFYRTSYRSVKAHQYDKDTRFIEVTCIKDAIPYPLDPATMTCNLKLQTPDGRHMFKTETIKPNGKIFIALEESMLLAAGICKAELNVYDIDSKKLLSTMPFDLIVIGSVYDNSIIEDSDEFSVLNDMIFYNKELGDRLEQLEADVTEAESERNENEETRKDNEINRQQNEIERQSNEITRQTNESVREASEDIRIENENFRKGNEDDRQGNEVIRQNNESIRESNETVRQNNELIRQSNESTREAEEEIRNANEDVRKNNEVTRQECETIRQTNESVRETGEDTRNTNEETRKNNEIDRQNAEKDRNNTFEQLQDTIDTKLANIEKVNIEPVSEANSYQIKVTDRNGNITTSPNLLHRLQIGTVETGDSDEEPTASITGDFGEQKLNLRLPTGKPFKIHKTYPSISEMNADVDNIELYEFVLIHTGSVEDEDTGKLYMKDISGMLFLTDLSGVQGIQGETGATPNLSIGSVTTGEPGTEASVQISGTKENPLLHLTIPRGAPGTIEDLSPEDIGALPVLTSSPSYNTFEDFWSDANKHGIKTNSHMCAMRFKDTGGWTPSLGWWCAIVGFQNGIGSQWSVTGRILLMSTGLAQGGQHVYYGLVDGGSTTTPEVSVTWYKVYSEIDKPSPTDIGALNYYSREELGIERSYIEDIIAALPNNSLYQGYAKKEDPVVAAAGITDNYSDLRIFKRSAWLIAVTVTTFGNRTYHWAGNSENPVKLVGTLPLTGGTVTGTIKSDTFEGGKGIFSGTYVSEPTQRYHCGALEIRENDRVASDQSDMAYAPTIGFHWGHRTAAMLLYHSDAKFYFRDQDGVSRATVDANLIGAVTPSGGLEYAGKDGWIAYPSDGDYQTDAASVTGYLVINLPQSWTDTMMKFAVTIFNYVTDTSVEYHISGYTYLDGKSWYNCSATCIGRAGAKTSNLTVRFGHDGTRCVILIGEPDSVWEYPHVKIHDVLLGLHNKEYSKWHSGWGVYISATTRPTITRIVSNTHVGYGSIAANALKVDNLAPYHAQAANTIVTRDAQGYTYLNYINCNTGDNENNYVSQVITTNGSDNFYRKVSLHHLKTSMALNNVDNIADTNKNVATAREVTGMYTGNGGAQPPSYVTSGRVRFNMMDRFPGFSANGYMDTILMDTYGGGDVPWVTGIGVTKAGGNPRMFIAVGSKGNSAGWSYMVEAITSGNIGSQSVNYAASAGNSDTVDGHHFNWSGQSGQPTWLWGGNDSTNMYVYNPSNFSVNYAASAGSATNDSAGRNIVNTYLPKSGGWMDGVLYVGNTDRCIQFWGNGPRLYSAYNNGLYICKSDGGIEKSGIAIWVNTDLSGGLEPTADNGMTLGSSVHRWKQVYAVSSSISTSDERLKDNIRPLDERLTHDFFMRLNPISYRSKEGDSGRTHWGLGSQSVEKAIEESGMTSMDFAGFIKSPMTEEIGIEEEVEVSGENGQKTVEVQKRMEQREIPGEYRYGLRYEEFISPLIKMVQMQQKQLEAQAEGIRELRESLKAVMARLDAIGA